MDGQPDIDQSEHQADQSQPAFLNVRYNQPPKPIRYEKWALVLRRQKSYAQGASSIADTGRPREAADKTSAPDVTSKTEFKRVISSTSLTSFVTFVSLKSIPLD